MAMSQKQGAKPYEELLADLNASYGLDKPVLEGYFVWLKDAVRGDFGESWVWTQPVTQKFANVIWYSFALSAVAFVLEIMIAIPLGIISATKQYSKADYAVTVFALIGISLPTFFFATILKWIFSINLGWFDLYGIVGRMHETYGSVGKVLDMAKHMVLPIVTLTIVSVGSLMRYTRTNMLEVLNSDYIRTARAKGVPEKQVINRHAFRNTFIPLVTTLGGSLPTLFSGALITETLFSIRGIGYASYHSMVQGDIPFTMFYLCFISILTLLGNLITDLLYAAVDPRVRLS